MNHYNSGRYYSALDAFRRLSEYSIDINPQLSASKLMTMKSYFHVGKYEDAAEVGRIFLEQFPGSSYTDDVHSVFGDISLSENWYQSAARYWLSSRQISDDPVLIKLIDEKLIQLSKGLLNQDEVKGLLVTESDSVNRSILNLMIASGLLHSGDPDGAALVLYRLNRETLPTQFQSVYDKLRKQTYGQPLESVMIGVVAPLSGPSGSEGRAYLRGIQEAAKRFSEDNYRIVLEVIDNEGDELKTTESVQILAANQNIIVILGPLSTSGSISASAALSKMKIPLILPTASRMGLTHVGDNVLQLNSTLFQQGRYAAEYAVSELNAETIAVVAPQDRFGKELTDGFLEKADALGAEVVTVEWYRGIPIDIGVQLSSLREVAFELAIPDTEIVITDAVLDTLDNTFIVEEMVFFPEEVAVEEDEDVDSTKIVLSSIDAVYLPIHTGDIQYVASQFSALLLETQLIGNGSWYDPLELSDDLISGNVDGMIILSNLVEPKHNNSQNQLIFFQDDFASRREFLIAMAGFDAVEFLTANLGSKPSRTKLMTSFESPQFYRGTSRIYSFTEQSPKVNSASSILQYHRGKFVTVAEIIADSLVSIIPSAP
ncbi:MAG: ABC transporter substrate-binding protein [Candidatus Marinimicrobia bacterium]|nr:ABC transporter substrate-binding protein [Candidatus Neomarinimicrobiota bacterium]MDP6568903.1 ABC transporter substrate-binding protein [Candidatus Neomarinimicrobiota bacterium]